VSDARDARRDRARFSAGGWGAGVIPKALVAQSVQKTALVSVISRKVGSSKMKISRHAHFTVYWRVLRAGSGSFPRVRAASGASKT